MDVYLTRLIEVTVMGVCLMERYASREPFGFAMAVLGSIIRPTTVDKFAVTDLQRIMNPSFIALDMLAIFVPSSFDF